MVGNDMKFNNNIDLNICVDQQSKEVKLPNKLCSKVKLLDSISVEIANIIRSQEGQLLDGPFISEHQYNNIDRIFRSHPNIFEKHTLEQRRETILKVVEAIKYGGVSNCLEYKNKLSKTLSKELAPTINKEKNIKKAEKQIHFLLSECEVNFIDTDRNSEEAFKREIKKVIEDNDLNISDIGLCNIVFIGKAISKNTKDFISHFIETQLNNDYENNKAQRRFKNISVKLLKMNMIRNELFIFKQKTGINFNIILNNQVKKQSFIKLLNNFQWFAAMKHCNNYDIQSTQILTHSQQIMCQIFNISENDERYKQIIDLTILLKEINSNDISLFKEEDIYYIFRF
ncbi:hypothetical protein AB837_00589 [bacterium AB1]|nr:hypothetical protein AB837_00589 [bacterium AB1]